MKLQSDFFHKGGFTFLVIGSGSCPLQVEGLIMPKTHPHAAWPTAKPVESLIYLEPPLMAALLLPLTFDSKLFPLKIG